MGEDAEGSAFRSRGSILLYPHPIPNVLICFPGMSFCRGSVNCHLSDGRMDHLCESSQSVEFFTGV